MRPESDPHPTPSDLCHSVGVSEITGSMKGFDMGNLITAEQLGERLSLKPGTIKRWAQDGIIPYLRLSGKVIRFDPGEVEEALKERALQSRKEHSK